MTENVKENTTFKKVMLFLGIFIAISVGGFGLYFLITNIQSILMLLLLIIGLIAVGIILFRISYLLFGFVIMIISSIVLLSIVGWVFRWVG
ncbi:hypothetical protein [Virgibacillus salexigens]|uniref:hypothetical protein n=1 Tax=Virgibacillus massiliensis TaxID=1462526 RepID=UPI00136D7060|nr:hypothetical protein [Virgibacillus massiliensis]MYL43978.1 hypothetical protein [Virgibacillus massiliensis]